LAGCGIKGVECLVSTNGNLVNFEEERADKPDQLVFKIYFLVGKGKAVPLQALSGPEGSRKLRFPDYMTTTQDGGKVVSLTHQPPLPPGNAPGTHFC